MGQLATGMTSIIMNANIVISKWSNIPTIK